MDDWYDVDVITSSAPFFSGSGFILANGDLQHLFEKRIENIFEAAIENEIDTIILGAWGCGAFHNPPEVVAGAFASVLRKKRYRHAFRDIVFSIKRTGQICDNLQAFQYSVEGAEGEIYISVLKIENVFGDILVEEILHDSFSDTCQKQSYRMDGFEIDIEPSVSRKLSACRIFAINPGMPRRLAVHSDIEDFGNTYLVTHEQPVMIMTGGNLSDELCDYVLLLSRSEIDVSCAYCKTGIRGIGRYDQSVYNVMRKEYMNLNGFRE